MNIKATEEMWAPFAAGMFARTDVETAGLLLAEPVGGDLIVRSAKVMPDEGYRIREPDRLQLDAVVMNRMTRPARDRGWAVLTVHTHPGHTEPWFSWADDHGDARLMPSFAALMPGTPHGSIVLTGERRGIARLFFEGTVVKEAALTVVGRTLSRLTLGTAEVEAPFARQGLALGAAGQHRLRQARVAVVGLGGTGSAVAVELFHLGVGHVTLIDGDTVSLSNLSRIFGARRTDVGRPKVAVAAQYAAELGLGTEVHAVGAHLGPELLEELGAVDVVFSCVDRHTPRALLNQLAYERLVPVIDMGTAFRVDAQTGVMTGDAGRVVVVGPGRPCLACWGHLDPDALRVEALSEEDRAGLAAEGYVQGMEVAQPSVVALNAQVASAAVVELMRLVTGFAGADDPPQRLAFSFGEGTVKRNRLAGDGRCRICGSDLKTFSANPT